MNKATKRVISSMVFKMCVKGVLVNRLKLNISCGLKTNTICIVFENSTIAKDIILQQATIYQVDNRGVHGVNP